jgi:inosose dehydratase
MALIGVACQTYTWEMLGPEWKGQVVDILDWVAAAGYAGLEITNNMIGALYDHPEEFSDELQRRSLCLAAFAYSNAGFADADLWDQDLAGALKAVDFLRHFPGACLGLGGAAHATPEDRLLKLEQSIRFYNTVGRIGADAGISVNIHPHSHHGSLLESAQDYEFLLERVDPQCVSLGPDTGHIVRGGQDLMTCLRTHRSRITHLHLKDVSAEGRWVPLGEGVCDFPEILTLLQSSGYKGWIVAEEESEEARRDGVAAIHKNRRYLSSLAH